MAKIVLGRRGFDASSENISAQESGVSDSEIVALGNQFGEGCFHTLKTLNLVSLRFIPVILLSLLVSCLLFRCHILY